MQSTLQLHKKSGILQTTSIRLLSFIFIAFFAGTSFHVTAQTVSANCAGATVLITIGTCTSDQSFTDATVNDPLPTGCVTSFTRDGWFKFTANATTRMSVTFTNSSTRDGALYVYSGTCAGLTVVACANNNSTGEDESVTFAATNGTSYFVRVGRTTGTTTPNLSGTICVKNLADAANDCTGALTLTQQTTYTPANYWLNNPTQSITALNCASSTSSSALDVWFKFVAGSTNPSIRVIPGPNFDPVIDIRSGACNGTNVTCADAGGEGGTETVTPTGLTIGATYYIRVYDFNSSGSALPPTQEFEIGVFGACATPAAPTSGGNANVCINAVPGSVSATPPAGHVIDWYSAATSGTLLLSNSNTYSTSTGGTYYAQSRNPVLGCVSSTRTAVTLTVNPLSVGGSVAGSTTVCSGTNSGNLTLSGHTGNVTKWQFSLVSDFSSGVNDIANTTTTLPFSNLTSTTYYRAVVTNGSCAAATSSIATVTVTPTSSISLTSGPSTQTVCPNVLITPIVYTIGGTSTGAFATGLPSGIFGNFTAGVLTISGSTATAFSYTVTTTGPCPSSLGGTISLNAMPTGLNVSPSSATICKGSGLPLVASATISSSAVVTSDNFNGTPTYASAGSVTGGNSQVWTKETSGTNVNTVGTFTSPNGGGIMIAVGGAQCGLGSCTSSANTSLTSAAINTVNYGSSLVLTYNHTYKQANVSGSGTVQISTDGINYTTIKTFTTNQGSGTAFLPDNIALSNTYLNQTNLHIRFTFVSSGSSGFLGNHSAWWAIDDVTLNGAPLPLFSWTANTGAGVNGLPANAGLFLASNNNITVTPTATTTYTLTTKDPVTNCAALTTTSIVTVNDPPIIGTQPANQTVCENGSISFNVVATGTGINYQWRKGSTNLTNGGNISGATSAILTINPVATGDAAANYNVVVTGTAPCTFVISNNVSLTVNTAPGVVCPGNAVINTDAGVCHATRTFSAAATGSPAPTVSYSIAGNPINFPYDFPVGTTTVDVLAEGACVPDATCSFTVTVNDLEGPIPNVASLPNATGECAVTVSTAPAATDACDGAFSGTTTDPLTYTSQGTFTIHWTYTDGKGNVSTQTQTVIVDDITAPLADVTTLPTVTGECSATVPAAPTATDNCVGSVTGTTTDPLTYNTQGTFTITWHYNDGNGNVSTQTQTVIVDDITAPVADVADLPTVTNECSVTVTAPTATDNCVGSVTGTTTDPTTYSVAGNYTILWSYNDGNGNISTQSQSVIVTDVNAPVPDVASLPNATGECSVTVTPPTATDACVGSVTGTTTDPLFYNTQGTFAINWTYDDGQGNVSGQTQTVIVDDITAPVPDVAVLPNAIGECSVTVTPPTATDNCVGSVTGTTSDPLTYNTQGTFTINWTYDDGNGNVSGQTQTVIVDDITAAVADVASLPNVTGECSATVSGAPTATDACVGSVTGTTTDPLTYNTQGTFTITWTYDDGNGNTSSQTQTVIVDDITAPLADVTTLPTVTGECSATVSGAPTATDNCVGSVTGTTTDPLTYNTQGTFTITWTYDDGNGNTSTQTQTVVVDDITAPVADVTNLPNATGECSVIVTAPTATDNCVGSVTGTTTDPLTYNTQGTFTINWTYDDGNGNTSSQTQTVIVDDITAPVADVTNLPNATGECSVIVTPPTATDNCVGSVTGTTTDQLTYNTQGTFTINWTYDDGNGNTSAQTQTVIVDDITAPVADVTNLPNATGECSVTVTPPTATDNCVGSVTGTTTDPLTYNTQGTFTINWTYDDGNGNVSAQTQTVVVDDITAPVADVASLPNVTGECSATVSGAPTATDNCVGSVTGTTTDPLTYNTQGTFTITWTYYDGNGNTSSQTQTVIVNDVTAPVINCPSAQTFCSVAGNNYTIPVLAASDNCGISTTTYQITGATNRSGSGNNASGIFNIGVSTIVWTVTDINNNSSSCSTTVSINIPPATPGTITGPTNACPYIGTNELVTYSIEPVPFATNYLWTVPATVSIVSGQGTTSLTVTINTGFDASPNPATRLLRVQSLSACGNSAEKLLYLLAQFPSTPGTITGPTNICALIGTANTATYTIRKVVAATSYAWTTPGTMSVTHPNGPGVNDTVIVVTFAPGYASSSITVAAVNGCGTSGSVRALFIPRTSSATPGLISGPTNVCSNILPSGTAATYSITPVPGATSYTWTAPLNATVTHPNPAGPNDYTITVQYPAGFTNGTISVSATNGCGTSGLRSLAISKLNPATPSVIDVIQLQECPQRVYSYTLSGIPANSTSLLWTIPTAQGAVKLSETSTSITISYPSTSVQGTITVQSINDCGSSSIRSTAVKLPACPVDEPRTGTAPLAKTSKQPVLLVGSESLDVKVFPNPSVNDFNLKVITAEKETINVRILDIEGRELKRMTVMPYQTIRIGSELKPGSYMIETRQGKQVKTTKVIKF